MSGLGGLTELQESLRTLWNPTVIKESMKLLTLLGKSGLYRKRSSRAPFLHLAKGNFYLYHS